jgi:hypothetical protein
MPLNYVNKPKKPINELKAGDKFKVICIPAEPWGHVLNGDIITLEDPPLVPKEWVGSGSGNTQYDSVLSYKATDVNCGIPYEWVEPVDEKTHSVKICTCNILTTGCVCGVFAEEQRAKGSSSGNQGI